MPKNIQDIVPGKRSVRDIPIPVRRIEKERAPIEESTVLPRLSPTEESPAPRKRKRSSKKGLLFGSLVCLVLIGLAAFSLRSGATLAYIPKTEVLSFDGDSYIAYQTAEKGQLPFSVIKLSSDKSIDAPATGEETVSEKARGQVVIYNEQSSSQPLVKTTRLETEDGKIYRIEEDVVIPAKGSLEVTAAADQAGAAYNIPLSDFTIPGFKGTAKFGVVYARSKTPMTGGFTGTRKKVSETDLVKAKTELEASLKSELLSQARAQMPEDFVLFPNLASITYEMLPVENSGGSNAKVTERGNLSAVIFKKSELASFLVSKKSQADMGTSRVEIADFSNLDIAESGGSPTDLLKADSLKVSVTGAANARFITDEASLATDLAGVPKTGVDAVLADYPSIESATSVVRPFWKSAFPSDPAKIKIEARQ